MLSVGIAVPSTSTEYIEGPFGQSRTDGYGNRAFR